MFKPIVNENSYHLNRVHKTQVQMMHDRGYAAINPEIRELETRILNDNFSFSEFKRYYPNRETMSQMYQNEQGLLTYVWYTETYEKSDFAKKVNEAMRNNVETLVMIHNSRIKDSERISFNTINTQIFNDIELIFNVTLHNYVPKHEALTPTEQSEFFSKNRAGVTEITPEQMPLIRLQDPVVKYYNFRPGSVIRIHRINFLYDTAVPETIFYRLVSKS